MARTPAPPPRANLSTEEARQAVPRLEARIRDLRELDLTKVSSAKDSVIQELQARIKSTLASIYGEDTAEYKRLLDATKLDAINYIGPLYIGAGRRPAGPTVQEIQQGIDRNRTKAAALLAGEVTALRERPGFAEPPAGGTAALDDSALRGRVLTTVFELRHQNGGRVPITDTIFSGFPPIDRQVMGMVCDHLQKANLIEWQPLFGSGSVGHAKITGFGIDVYLGKARSPIDINLPGRTGAYATDGYGMGLYGGPQPGPGPVPSPPMRVSEGVLAAVGSASMQAVAIAVRENREAIQFAGTALAILVDDKLHALRNQRLNSPEAQAQIEKYEELKSKIDALCEAVSTPLVEPAEEESAFRATLGFVDTLKDWWQQRHVVALDTGLFLSSVAICHLTGASDLVVAICGTVAGGKSVAEVIKAFIADASK